MSATILIVDDHSSFRTFARRLLESAGFRVVEAADGEGALEASASSKPDLVLLDIQLPAIDGFEVATRLAGDGGPVVVLTSSREASDYGGRVAASPAAGFLPKAEISPGAISSFLAKAR
jgi:CheY-like chemotaxis protein